MNMHDITYTYGLSRHTQNKKQLFRGIPILRNFLTGKKIEKSTGSYLSKTLRLLKLAADDGW